MEGPHVTLASVKLNKLKSQFNSGLNVDAQPMDAADAWFLASAHADTDLAIRLRRRKGSLVNIDFGTNLANTVRERFGKTVGSVLISVYGTLSGRRDIGRFEEVFACVSRGHASMLLYSEPTFASMKSIEAQDGVNSIKPYRDHVLHPIVAYVLGRKLLAANDGQLLGILADELKRSEAAQMVWRAAGYDQVPDHDTWRSIILSAWCLAAMTHDLGYVLEPGLLIEELFFHDQMFANVIGEQSVLEAKLANALDERIASSRNNTWLSDYMGSFRSALNADNHSMNHGQCIALLLLLKYTAPNDFSERANEEKLTLLLAINAAFWHDRWTNESDVTLKELRTQAEPFTKFFCLVDLLAEVRLVWERSIPKARNRFASNWSFDVWVPLKSIDIAWTVSGWECTFGRSRAKVGASSGVTDYKYDEIASQKKEEHLSGILQQLNVLNPDEKVSLKISG
jgi:hypothetical protein